MQQTGRTDAHSLLETGFLQLVAVVLKPNFHLKQQEKYALEVPMADSTSTRSFQRLEITFIRWDLDFELLA